MKKVLAFAVAAALCVSTLAACGGSSSSSSAAASSSDSTPAKKSVTLNVVTSYGGDDGNRKNYEAAYKAYESATGNTVLDGSETSNEEWKAKVNTDFETGSEPDVLFYFSGVDSNKIVEAGKVVSIEEIRAEYPDYASNMKDDILPVSPADGKAYSVPVNGFWENMFVNKVVLDDCGVEMPDENTTWEEFLVICQTIKDKGYTPIAVSLENVPHYWFEFAVLNAGSPANHLDVPANGTDAVAEKWAAGFDDITALYEAGFLPANTLTASDDEAWLLMYENEAAFAIDGSWKMGAIKENALNPEEFSVTFVPGKGDRATTDVLGGISMGYYITRKAWDDPEKRDAAVEFVMAMTTDEVVSTFGATAVTALKNGTIVPDGLAPIEEAAIAMNKKVTSVTAPVQDLLMPDVRGALFADVKNIVVGNTTTADAIDAALAIG